MRRLAPTNQLEHILGFRLVGLEDLPDHLPYATAVSITFPSRAERDRDRPAHPHPSWLMAETDDAEQGASESLTEITTTSIDIYAVDMPHESRLIIVVLGRPVLAESVDPAGALGDRDPAADHRLVPEEVGPVPGAVLR